MSQHDETAALQRLAAALRAAWQQSGLTQRELAVRTRYFTDPAYLARAFSGKQRLSLGALEAVASVLGKDHSVLLADAGLDEVSYRSRFAKPSGRSTSRLSARSGLRQLLADELQIVRDLKHEGRPDEARGVVGTLERVITHQLGGLPRERETLVYWAALLFERIGIVKDARLPSSPLVVVETDLATLETIATEHDAEDVLSQARFQAGDVYFKEGAYDRSIPCYQWSAAHAPTTAWRARALTGWAISLALRQEPGDIRLFYTLRGQVQDLLAGGEQAVGVQYVWDNEGWSEARRWSEETLGRILVRIGDVTEAERQLDTVTQRFERGSAEGLVDMPFAAALARSRFLAACEGAFDMGEQDVVALGQEGLRLANETNFYRVGAQVKHAFMERFGGLPPGTVSPIGGFEIGT